MLRANMTENTYLLDGDVLADGRYFFKVHRVGPAVESGGCGSRCGTGERSGADR